MDMQNLLRLGAEAFLSQISSGETGSGGLTMDRIMQALADLLPGDGDQVDLGALVGRMEGGGLADMAQSWLGDGGNRGIDAAQVKSLLGGDAISGFAKQLGLGETEAVAGLESALPAMIDRASSGGSLDLLGGASGLLGAAGSLFGR